MVPLDFGTKDFYLLRADKIEARLAEIEAMTAEKVGQAINESYARNKHKYNALVRFDSLKLTQKRLV